MHILFVTSQLPTTKLPHHSPFVREKVEALRSIGISVDVFHYQSWNPIHYINTIFEFHRKLRERRYDIVYVRFGQCGLVAISKWWIPVVVRYGGRDLIGWKIDSGEPLSSKLLTSICRLVTRRANFIILPSAEMATCLPGEKIRSNSIRCEPRAFPPLRFIGMPPTPWAI